MVAPWDFVLDPGPGRDEGTLNGWVNDLSYPGALRTGACLPIFMGFLGAEFDVSFDVLLTSYAVRFGTDLGNRGWLAPVLVRYNKEVQKAVMGLK